MKLSKLIWGGIYITSFITFVIPTIIWGYLSAYLAKKKIAFNLGAAFVGPNDVKNFKRGDNPLFWWGNDMEGHIIHPQTGVKHKLDSQEGKAVLLLFAFNTDPVLWFKRTVYGHTGLVYYGIPFLDYADSYRKKWNMDNPDGVEFDDAMISRDELTDLQKINYYYGFALREIEILGEVITKQLWFADLEIFDFKKARYSANPDLLGIVKRKLEAIARALSGPRDWKTMRSLAEVKINNAGEVTKSEIMTLLALQINKGPDGLEELYGARLRTLDFAKIDFDYNDPVLIKQQKEASMKAYASEQNLVVAENTAKGNDAINKVDVEKERQLMLIKKELLEAYAKNEKTVQVSRNNALENTNIGTFVEGGADVNLLLNDKK